MNRLAHAFVFIAGTCMFAMLAYTLVLVSYENTLEQTVEKAMHDHAISHDVTAVLLDFRSLDTLLEVAVIVMALVGIKALSPHFRYRPRSFEMMMTNTYVALVFPIIVITALYILNSGTYQSGGAFAASALLAGGFIIIRLTKPTHLRHLKETHLRFIYCVGLLFFILIGLLSLFYGNFMQYPHTYSYWLIFCIEAMLTLSLSVILATYFINAVQRFK
jgi:multisubunit Na+/H+ antiporter MnhB subunit